MKVPVLDFDKIQDEWRNCAGEGEEAKETGRQEHDGGAARDGGILEGINTILPEMTSAANICDMAFVVILTLFFAHFDSYSWRCWKMMSFTRPVIGIRRCAAIRRICSLSEGEILKIKYGLDISVFTA